jgi:hypothetical protein
MSRISLSEVVEFFGFANVRIYYRGHYLPDYLNELANWMGCGLVSDKDRAMHLYKLSEQRHKWKDNYKLSLVSATDDPRTTIEHFYIRDMEMLIEQGQASLYVETEDGVFPVITTIGRVWGEDELRVENFLNNTLEGLGIKTRESNYGH